MALRPVLVACAIVASGAFVGPAPSAQARAPQRITITPTEPSVQKGRSTRVRYVFAKGVEGVDLKIEGTGLRLAPYDSSGCGSTNGDSTRWLHLTIDDTVRPAVRYVCIYASATAATGSLIALGSEGTLLETKVAVTPAGADPTTTTTSPFGGALELQRLGRDEAAKDAALKVIEGKNLPLTTADGTPCPSSSNERSAAPCSLQPLVEDQPTGIVAAWDWLIEHIQQYWKWIASLLVILLLAWLWLVRRNWSRMPACIRIPKRVYIDVRDETGQECKLTGALATRIREELGRGPAQTGMATRTAGAADADAALPDLAELPDKAKWLLGLARWWSKQRGVTLSVTLLPPMPSWVGCHVSLVLPNGQIVHDTSGDRAERILRYRSQRQGADGAVTPISVNDLVQLVNLIAAWTLYEFGHQFQTPSWRSESGTAIHDAQEAYLDGLERLTSAPAGADKYFELAYRLDDTFTEAMLNSGYCRAAINDHDWAIPPLKQALAQTTFIGGPPDDTPPPADLLAWLPSADDADLSAPLPTLPLLSPSRAQQLGIAIRAQYSLAVVAVNRVTVDLLAAMAADDDALDEAETEVRKTQRIVDAVHDGRAKGNRSIEAVVLEIGDHVCLLTAGVCDLQAKRQGYHDRGFPRLPLTIGRKPLPAGTYPPETVVDAFSYYLLDTTGGRPSYSLACTWARDLRLRVLEPTVPLPWPPVHEPPFATPASNSTAEHVVDEIVRLLKIAISVSPQYKAGWQTDPDFKPLKDVLKKRLSPEAKSEPTVYEVGEKWVLQLANKDS